VFGAGGDAVRATSPVRNGGATKGGGALPASKSAVASKDGPYQRSVWLSTLKTPQFDNDT
jgi:hypothetical protein